MHVQYSLALEYFKMMDYEDGTVYLSANKPVAADSTSSSSGDKWDNVWF